MIFNEVWDVAQLFMQHLLQYWRDRICPGRDEVHRKMAFTCWKPLPQSYNPADKSKKSVVEVLTINKQSQNSNLQRCKHVLDLVVCILKFV
jgi:hypothetical protein